MGAAVTDEAWRMSAAAARTRTEPEEVAQRLVKEAERLHEARPKMSFREMLASLRAAAHVGNKRTGKL
jgi:2-iminoacetate synthase ThiH